MLQGVREVSLLADAQAPTEITQRAFDAARSRSHRFSTVLRAKRIAEQLRLSWREVLALAHEPPDTHAHRLSRKHSEQQDWLTEDYIAFALSSVAHRLGRDSISPSQYRSEREKMLAADRKHWLHGRQLILPTDDQIRIALGGDWNHALALAGLVDRQLRTGVGASTMDLLERCYAAHGAQPSAEELRRFARANRIPYQPDRSRSWNACVELWKEGRRARGLDVPAGLPPRGQRPNYARNVGAARPGECRRRDWSHIEDCVEIVVIYLAEIGSRRSSKRSYQDWAADQADAPSPSAFDQHGGWGRVRAMALERL